MRNGKNSEIILGALLGGAIAGGISIFLNSKSGRAFRHNVIDGYHALGDTLEDVVESVSDRAEKFKEQFIDSAEEARTTGKKKAKSLAEKIDQTCESAHVDAKIGLLVGALLGGLVTAGLSTLIATNHVEESQLSSISRRVSPYLREFKHLVGNLSEYGGDIPSKLNEFKKEAKSGIIQEALDFTIAGAKLWQNLQDRRR